MKTIFRFFVRRFMILFFMMSPILVMAQTSFSSAQNILSQTNGGPMDVHLTDMDRDGDLDIVYSYPVSGVSSGVFSWLENLDGQGNYGTPQTIASVSYFMGDIHSADIDLDGDMDLITVNSAGVERISWFKNLDCEGNFSASIPISGPSLASLNCFPTDIDGDGDIDVLTHTQNSPQGDNIVWYENTDGLGNFGPSITIYNFPANSVTNMHGDVYAADLDGDGDMDVLAGSPNDNQIDWYENLDGLGNFGGPQTIATAQIGLGYGNLYAVDIDGDGDMDVLTGNQDDKISWYENTNGLGSFGTQQIIFSFSSNDLNEIFPVDADGDGDIDVVSAQNYSISWFENINCTGTFGAEQIIKPYATGTNSGGSELSIGDIDGDGDQDVLIGDGLYFKIESFENIPPANVFYIPEELYICDGVFEQLCGPLSSSCNSYTYTWYYNNQVTQTTELVTNGNAFEQCYTPDQYGDYFLVVEDGDGGYTRYNTSIIELLPEPIITSSDEICAGEMIMLLNEEVYNHCNYEFTWLHNGIVVQQGGSVLATSFTSGTVTLEVSNSSCPDPVSATVTIVECCPTDLEIIMNCETGRLEVQNIPNNIAINTIFWNLNNELIPSATNTTLQVTETGTYSFGIIFTLSNGEECHHFIHFEYFEQSCCEETGPKPVATILNSESTYFLEETNYGPMTVPVVDCRLSIDASLTTCEDSYHITIQAFNPINWSPAGPIIYNQVFTGQAPNLIEIPSSVFPPQSNGQFYILTFSAGLPWVPTYIGFWYTCKADIKRSGKSLEFQKADKELITLFPNPTNYEIILRTSFDSGTYQIYDLQGKILDQNILNTQNTVIDLSRFSAGTYFLKIETASGEIHFKKVIKE